MSPGVSTKVRHFTRCLGLAVPAGVHDSEQGQAQQGACLPQHQGSHCFPAAGMP